jgi:hypothetical protein
MAEGWAEEFARAENHVGNRFRHYENDSSWKVHTDKAKREWDQFRATPAPTTRRETKKRSEALKKFLVQFERDEIIFEAHLGRRGQGGIAKALFQLDDSINKLEHISTKLNKWLIALTIVGLILSLVVAADAFGHLLKAG